MVTTVVPVRRDADVPEDTQMSIGFPVPHRLQ